MMRKRSPSVSVAHEAISAIERLQPSHSPVAGFMMQTLTQGVCMLSG